MKTTIDQTENSLRQRAEELLSKKKSKTSYIAVEADNLKLIHELEVYKIELDMQQEELLNTQQHNAEKIKIFHELELQRVELEMQNEELLQARAKSEQLAQKYKTLYDFAPSGYFTLNSVGEILELNLSGASMLGKERNRLINSRLAFFVTNNTKPFFQLFLDKIFISNKKETCEITLNIECSEPCYLHLTGVESDNNQCFVTAIDITKRKLAEDELLLKNIIFDTSISANSIANLDGIITEVNNEFYFNWGYRSKYEVLGKPLSTFFQKEGEAVLILNHLNKLGQWEGEFIARRVDGSTFIANGVATVVRDKYGKVIGYQSSVLDVTTRKKAEEALQASQLLLSSSIESVKDMVIFSIDRDYNYLVFNSYHKFVMNKLYGIELSTNINMLDSITNDEDRLKAKKNFDIALSGKSHFVIQEYGDLERIIYEIRYNPIINDMNEVIGATAFAFDVTEREKNKEIVEVTTQSYHNIIDTVSEAIYIIDQKGTFIEVNKGAEKMYGYTHEELIGKTPYDLADLEQNDMEAFGNMMQNVTKTGVSSRFEFWGKRKNGESFPKSIIVNKGVFFKKHVLIATARDITERKQAEMELQFSENRFRKLLQDVDSISVQGYAPDGTTQYWNHASEKLYGFTAEEAIGKNLLDLIIPSEIHEGVQAAISSMAETGVPIPTSELMLKRKDGSLVSVYSYHTIVQVPGKPQELFCIDIDLTERKLVENALMESEERYRLLFANSPQPMWIYDLETLAFLEVNQSAIEHYGYSREEFLAMTIKDIRPAEDIPIMLKAIELAKTPSDINTKIVRHTKKNGHVIFVEISAHSLNYNNKNVRYVLVNDITHKKQIEERLVKTQADLKVFAAHLQNIREEERILLAHEIHDELAQILVAIKFDMGIMKQKLARGINIAASEDFKTNFNQIFNLVDNTIHTARKIMSGLRSDVLELIGLNETVKLYTVEFEKRHNIRCNITLSGTEIVLNSKKSITLFRVYQEALTNVARHAEATQINIFFAVVENNLIMEVIDNGKGFDINDQGKPGFFGIIGMKERVFLLDGKIEINSKQGNGTSLRVEMPY